MRVLLLLSLALLQLIVASEYDNLFTSEALFGTQAYNHTMLWGTYRPQTYFGMKTRSSRPIVTGIIWHDAVDRYGQQFRHSCDMGDGVNYGWKMHDGRYFGEQVIDDTKNNFQMTIQFVKHVLHNEQHQNGGDWAVRISGKYKNASRKPKISLAFYIAKEDVTMDNMDMETFSFGVDNVRPKGQTSPVIIRSKNGQEEDTGDFTLVIQEDAKKSTSTEALSEEEMALQRFHVTGMKLVPNSIWRAKDIYQQKYAEFTSKQEEKRSKKKKDNQHQQFYTTLSNHVEHGSNMIYVQRLVGAPFQIDIALLSHEVHGQLDAKSAKKIADTTLIGAAFPAKFDARKNQYNQRINSKFPMLKDSKYRPVALYALSSLIGGMGYWYGNSYHQYGGEKSRPIATYPYSLYSAVPARSFFPRGFLWDEGFHQLVIQQWDPEITKDVMTHWMHAMDDGGWIPREQILGDEARSKVPMEFQVQQSLHANPPMHFFALAQLVQSFKNANMQAKVDAQATTAQVSKKDAHHVAFLKHLYPLLQKNLEWYSHSQRGPGKSYQWKGRLPGHTLASGLDDYPRGTPEPKKTERHLDLYCWMYMMNGAMQLIHDYIGEAPTNKYKNQMEQLRANINDLHWNDEIEWYSDYVGVQENVTTLHSNHIGYVSLFPLLVHILGDHDAAPYKQILHYLQSPAHLRSLHGLRSLSKIDDLYGKEENYWRGPIWININYLTLRSLYHLMQKQPNNDQVKTAYTKLRTDLIRTIKTSFEKTGTLHEQYHPETGEGQRSHPFTGWTTLIFNIILEKF